jgi:1-phosphofructokinase
MIYTVTLNPAIDKTVVVNDFSINTVNRVQSVREDAGGKGINVSKMIKKLKGNSIAISIVGGNNGKFIKQKLKEIGIKSQSFLINGETRVNTKIVDPVNNFFTDINELGPNVKKSVICDIETYLKRVLVEDDIIVLSGSLPSGVPIDLYRRWSELANDKKAKVLLDADKKILKEGIKGKPFLIKPNEKELENYFGVEFKNKTEIRDKCREIFDKGVKVVVVSLGVDGCMLMTKDNVVSFDPIKVEVKSTVGAGDSMLAAIAYELDKHRNLSKISIEELTSIVSLGVAASSATIEQEGTIMGNSLRIKKFYEMVKTDRSLV